VYSRRQWNREEGIAGTAFIKKRGEVIESSEMSLIRFRPEFSYVPEAK